MTNYEGDCFYVVNASLWIKTFRNEVRGRLLVPPSAANYK